MRAAVPGLLGKVWLKGPDENVYGRLYLWREVGDLAAAAVDQHARAVVDDGGTLAGRSPNIPLVAILRVSSAFEFTE